MTAENRISSFDLSKIQQPKEPVWKKISESNVEEDRGIEGLKLSDSAINVSQTIDDIESSFLEASEAIEAKEEAEEAGDTKAAEEAEEAADAALDEAEELEEAAQVAETADVSETRELSEEEQEELEELEKERDKNNKKMEKIEDEIKSKTEKAEANIVEAAAQQESAVKDHEEEAQDVMNKNLTAYINANREGGEGMSRDQLQENIRKSMPNAPDVSDALAKMTEASGLLDEVDALLGDLNDLANINKGIEAKINAMTVDPASLGEVEEPEEEQQQTCCPPPCEPQGFQDTEGNQYDFFIDKDGNGDLSTEQEFLGYEGGLEGQEAAWEEMTSLDTDADGVVTADELSEGGVMVYKTDENGNQEAMTVEEAFGEDADLAISTEQHEEAKEGVGPNNFDVGKGSENNELWGTFDVTLDGEELDGYQTNDDIDWLKDNYDFTEYEDEDINDEFADTTFSDELQSHISFYEEYTEKSQELREEITSTYKNIGMTDEQIVNIENATKAEAAINAQKFIDSLDEEDDEEQEVATESTDELSEATDKTTTTDEGIDLLPEYYEIEPKAELDSADELDEELIDEDIMASDE